MESISKIPEIDYTRKYKKYQRDSLFSLYCQHADYLLSAIKTAEIQDEILSKIDLYIEDATCHEVAINDLSDLELETHENRLGKEKQIANHPDGKKISRDMSVKMIWFIIKSELEKDFDLELFEEIETDEVMPKKFEIICPYCNTIVYSVKRIKEYYGYHCDGTRDWHYSYDFGGAEWDTCKHYIVYDSDYETEYLSDDLTKLFNELFRLDYSNYLDLIEEFGKENLYDIQNDRDLSNNQNIETRWTFVENLDKLVEFLNNKIKENEEE